MLFNCYELIIIILLLTNINATVINWLWFQVKFHKTKTELLATGSIDGLLNIFNVTELTEDDALTYTLNVENSVEKLSWLDEKQLACITQSSDLQLWDADKGDMLKSFTRDKVSRSIKVSSRLTYWSCLLCTKGTMLLKAARPIKFPVWLKSWTYILIFIPYLILERVENYFQVL